MRAVYTILATALMVFALTGALTPLHVFAIASLMGLIRPSDMGMRAALVGDTMPAAHLMGAMGIQRTTSDSARIAGALTGAGLVATLGMGPAYVAIAAFYAISFALTLKASRLRFVRAAQPAPASPSPWRDLKDAAAYVWNTPHLLGTMWLAFLINFTAYPLVNALLPYVAKEMYGTDQTGLGYLVAAFATGALVGSIALSRTGSAIRPARMMIVFCAVWYVMILVFARMESFGAAVFVLFLTGCAQSLGMVPMSAMLLRNSDVQYRGRLMGLRMLAIYGLPLGLLLAGPLVARFGYPATATLYSMIGLALVGFIALRWRDHLWRRDAPANVR
jgi:Na+/melibiose symporter-like transporter